MKRIYINIVILLCVFCNLTIINGQINHKYIVEEDSIINLMLKDSAKLDTFFSLGQHTVVYKKILGIIKIKTATGDIYTEEILYRKEVLCYHERIIIKRFNSHEYRDCYYYYLNKKLVKYVDSVFLVKESNQSKRSKHYKVSYFKDNVIVTDELSRNNKNTFTSREIKIILDNAYRDHWKAN